MEIHRQKSDHLLVIRLVGRLDANWCTHVQNALGAAVREGEHRIHLNMAEVNYVSSAGLRVLLSFYKQLRGINGLFGVARPSPAVRSVLELAGLEMLLATDETGAPSGEEQGQAHASPSARYEIFKNPAAAGGIRLEVVGEAARLQRGSDPASVTATEFGARSFALGIGALGGTYADCAPRFGEFLAVNGIAAFQPADGSSRPDFVVSESAFVPEGRLLLGLSGEGGYSTLARFEATAEARTMGLAELAAAALELSGARTAAFVAVTETAGLVGASLRRSPAAGQGTGARFSFPEIRDWLSFTSERAFRDSTSLLVGVVSRPGSPLDPLLRPLGATRPGAPESEPGLIGHVHAAVFPYRPLRKGRIEMKGAVADLFEGQSLQAVLHLLGDSREFNGAGESEFLRGAMWIAPVTA